MRRVVKGIASAIAALVAVAIVIYVLEDVPVGEETFAEAALACNASGSQAAPARPMVRAAPRVSSPRATATPVALQRGPHVSSPTLLASSAPGVNIGSLFAVSGNQLAFHVASPNVANCVFLMDLGTGMASQIASLKGALTSLALSDQYLVWTDQNHIPGAACPGPGPAGAPGRPAPTPLPPCTNVPLQATTDLLVYDLQTRQRASNPTNGSDFALSGSILVWRSQSGLRGQDLATGQTFTVTTRLASDPQISGDWVAFSNSVASPDRMRVATLYLVNWRTGVEKVVGPVSAQVNGAGYAIAEGTLAWVKAFVDPKNTQPPLYELHLYSLSSGQDRAIGTGNNQYLGPVVLSKDFLGYYQAGWRAVQISNGTLLDLFPTLVGGVAVSTLRISGNRLVWTSSSLSPGRQQLYAATVAMPPGPTPYP